MKRVNEMKVDFHWFNLVCSANVSPRGRRSNRKGKGIRVRDHARGRREEGNACKEAIVFAIPPTN